jgi:hypothetical protein
MASSSCVVMPGSIASSMSCNTFETMRPMRFRPSRSFSESMVILVLHRAEHDPKANPSNATPEYMAVPARPAPTAFAHPCAADVPRRERGESRAKTTLFARLYDPRDRESDGSFQLVTQSESNMYRSLRPMPDADKRRCNTTLSSAMQRQSPYAAHHATCLNSDTRIDCLKD